MGEKKLKDWLKSGEYLPEPLRDFHNQKAVFKIVWNECERQLKGETSAFSPLNNGNWIMMQVYTVDFFLKVMAATGWTLQRSRKDMDFADLNKAIKEMYEEEVQDYLNWRNKNE